MNEMVRGCGMVNGKCSKSRMVGRVEGKKVGERNRGEREQSKEMVPKVMIQ